MHPQLDSDTHPIGQAVVMGLLGRLPVQVTEPIMWLTDCRLPMGVTEAVGGTRIRGGTRGMPMEAIGRAMAGAVISSGQPLQNQSKMMPLGTVGRPQGEAIGGNEIGEELHNSNPLLRGQPVVAG